ncbi:MULTISPECIES: DUF3892 domain-containing protein [Clostridium]|uniref:DUF3892 domain-containing protein n=1 Tax=Clostridium TaxID=1485 RepID=UPI0008268E56|nr:MULTISPECIES: DUF3892 domain-containing protein [Clostridium]PJI09964.1 DUF3892 domain-containing protein [Clostridium sp. CT7]
MDDIKKYYAITEACYKDNEERKTILAVKAYKCDSKEDFFMGKISNDDFEKLSRKNVIELIENTNVKEVFTAYMVTGEWDYGEEVIYYPKDNPKYIKTKKDDIKEDNLGNLPILKDKKFVWD